MFITKGPPLAISSLIGLPEITKNLAFVFAFTLSSSPFVNNIKGSTLILLTKGENLTVKAKSNAKFLIISGKPINEEIARGGPFVMNTKAEILQAVQDYHNGTFVK